MPAIHPGLLALAAAVVVTAPVLTETAPQTVTDAPIAATIHVAPNGAGTGCTDAAPCGLDAALAAVRSANDDMTGDLVVQLAPGDYRLEETIELGVEESGTNGFQVRFTGGGDARLSGGVDLTSGWTLSDPASGIWTRDASGLDFRQLYVDTERAVRARTPNLERTADGGPYLVALDANPSARTYRVQTADLPAGDLTGVEFISTSWWYQNILRIADITAADATTSTISFAEPERSIGFGQSAKYYEDNPFKLEGSIAFLDAPGEWHLDPSGVLSYLPRPGDVMNSTPITAPRLETLVRISGNETARAHDIVLDGLVFEHTNWTTPGETGLVTTQGVLPRPVTIETGSANPIPGAVEIAYAEHIAVTGSEVARTGAHGLQVVRSANDIDIVTNAFTDIAGNAVHLDALTKLQPSESERTHRVLVGNNTITRFGRDYANGQGIAAFYLSESIIEHNLIADGYYTGIQVGFQQRAHLDGGSGDVKIRYNEIHHTNQLLGDGGGIYTLGRQLGTEISGNYVHDIVKGPADTTTAPIAGIYFDNYTEYATAHDNVLQNVRSTIHRQTAVGARSNPTWNNPSSGAAIVDRAGPSATYSPGASSTVRLEMFNAATTGLPGYWTEYRTAGTVGTVATTPAGNRALRVEKPGASGVAAALLDVGSLGGTVEVDASFVLDDTASWKALAYLHPSGYVPGSGSLPLLSIVAYQGTLSAYDGATHTALVPVVAGNQYSVKLVVDTATQTYRVFVNGTQRGGTLPFRTTAADVGVLYTGIGSGHAGAFRLDNVAVAARS